MRKIAYFAYLALLFGTLAAHAQCGSNCYFYGGDFDPNNPNTDGLANESDAFVPSLTVASPAGAATFQNFKVGGAGIKVTGLFTNNLSDLNPNAAYWEIRTGVAQNNPGTLFASGLAFGTNFTHTANGRSDFGYNEYKDWAAGLSVTLTPGTYWFSVVPLDTSTFGRSFNSNTFGLNAVGTQVSDKQFFNSAYFGAKFDNADLWGVYPTFSSGVYDDPLYGGSAPEPSSLVLLASGVAGIGGVLRRRVVKASRFSR